MPTYVDSSVIISALFNEPRTLEAKSLLATSGTYLISDLTKLEVRRNIGRLATGSRLQRVRAKFDRDMKRMIQIAITGTDWLHATEIAEETLAKSLDALHLAVALKLNPEDLTFLTFDKKQAIAARSLGFSVVGA